VSSTAQSAIHRVALGSHNRPSTIQSKLVVGILQHQEQLTGENFLWFIAKPKYSVERLQSAYIERTQVGLDVTFKLGGSIVAKSTPLSQLNVIGDNLIVLTAHISYMEPSAPIPGSSTRAPLQPVNRKMHTLPAIKVESKVEPIDEPPKLNAAPVYSGSDDQVKEEHGGYNNVDHISAKHESDEEGISMADGAPPALVERVSLSASIQNVIDEGNPERL